ncbi:RHG25 protein, partial [Spelaeornis formosus]|nr:RHG25 protein [Elachura formosa]
ARSRSVQPGGDPDVLAVPGALSQLQRGWLRRQQRSRVRPWQLRFFELRDRQLLCYRDSAEPRPQVRPHRGLGGEPGTPGIPTGHQKWSPRVLKTQQGRAGQEPCVLMASSQLEMEAWVKSIRRALGCAAGGKNGSRESSYSLQCSWVRACLRNPQTGAGTGHCGCPGIGKKSQKSSATNPRATSDPFPKCHRALKAGLPGDPTEHGRDGSLGHILLLFNNKLIITILLELFLTFQGHQELLKQLSLLPRDNYNLLSYICRFLYEIQLNSSINKMSVENLATVIGVNLIRPRMEDPAIIMRGTPQVQKVMTVMISDHQKLFPPSKDVPPSSPASHNEKKSPIPRSSVGWGAAEDPSQRQRTDTPSPSSSPGPAATPSVPGEATEPRDPLSTWGTEPRKRTQTLPTRKPLVAAAAGGHRGSQEKNEVLASDFWSSSPQAGHKRTLSHDLFKLLDLHRASACDSVPACRADGDSSPSPASSVPEWEFLPCSSPSHEQQVASPASPGEQHPPGTELLQTPVPSLEKGLEAQRSDREGQIESLQQEKDEAWAKVVRLQQDLEQERKRSGELELRLRNAERSREELEKKTKLLEEEIKNLMN